MFNSEREHTVTSVETINNLPASELRDLLVRCCGAERWIEGMLRARPFADWNGVMQTASLVWDSLQPSDWKESFKHHPKIGDIESLRKKFSSTAGWAGAEQGACAEAPVAVLHALAEGNSKYEEKFGYIFIVCATGKRAEEMLEILNARLPNEPGAELRNAAAEQIKITLLRLEKIRNEPDNNSRP
jgi:2-oxo-4-hydroxy-4-carboxy-5-ureidoimidazoline decarboxylase